MGPTERRESVSRHADDFFATMQKRGFQVIRKDEKSGDCTEFKVCYDEFLTPYVEAWVEDHPHQGLIFYCDQFARHEGESFDRVDIARGNELVAAVNSWREKNGTFKSVIRI